MEEIITSKWQKLRNEDADEPSLLLELHLNVVHELNARLAGDGETRHTHTHTHRETPSATLNE